MIRGGLKEMRIRGKLSRTKRLLQEADAEMGRLALSPHPDAPALLAEHLPEARALRERAMELINKAQEKLHEQR